jgi:putative phage-type endonuclease
MALLIEIKSNTMITTHVQMLLDNDKKDNYPQRSKEWFEKRRQHLTASQIAAASSNSPYESRNKALKKKVGLMSSFSGNCFTEHGNKYEGEAIQLYEKVCNKKVLSFGLLKSINENESFLAGSPDGITTDGILIEVKCPLKRIPGDFVPPHYMYQIQTLMHILRIDKCDFIQYKPHGTWSRQTMHVTRVDRCDIFWDRIYPSLRNFWDEVLEIRDGRKELIHIPPKKKNIKNKDIAVDCNIVYI